MNCRVSAAPATATPGFQEVRPCRWGERMPRRLSSPLAVALPIFARPSTRSRGGRTISGVSIMMRSRFHSLVADHGPAAEAAWQATTAKAQYGLDKRED